MRQLSSRVTAVRSCVRAIVVVLAALVPFALPIVLAQQIIPSYFAEMRWRSIGPPRSGYVSAPAGVPGDPTTYYAGMPEGGVWKTTNGGTTWTPVFDDVHIASVGAVAVAPSDPKIVYVGTGNQTGWSFSVGKGAFKSTDAGKTWTNIGLSTSQYIGGIVVDPRNADIVLVAAIGPRAAGRGGAGRAAAAANPANATTDTAAERGVYRSADGGRSWTRVLPSDGSSGASDVYMDYRDPQMVYALLAGGFPGAPQAAPAQGTGAFKSVDGGVTWQPVGGRGLPDGARISAFAVASGTTAAGSTPSPEPAAAVARVDAVCIAPTMAERLEFGTRQLASAGGKNVRGSAEPRRRVPDGHGDPRSSDAGARRRVLGRPSGADRASSGSIRRTRGGCSPGVDQGAAHIGRWRRVVDAGPRLAQRTVLPRVDRLRFPVPRLRPAAGLGHGLRA